MKVLNFTEVNKEFFKIIYEGLCLTGAQFTGKEQRRLDKIFALFEDNGKSTEEKNVYNFQELKSVPATIEIEDADFDIVKKAFDSVQWNGFGARKAGKVLSWLDETPVGFGAIKAGKVLSWLDETPEKTTRPELVNVKKET